MLKWLLFFGGIVTGVGFLSMKVTDPYIFILPILMIIISIILQAIERIEKKEKTNGKERME